MEQDIHTVMSATTFGPGSLYKETNAIKPELDRIVYACMMVMSQLHSVVGYTPLEIGKMVCPIGKTDEYIKQILYAMINIRPHFAGDANMCMLYTTPHPFFSGNPVTSIMFVPRSLFMDAYSFGENIGITISHWFNITGVLHDLEGDKDELFVKHYKPVVCGGCGIQNTCLSLLPSDTIVSHTHTPNNEIGHVPYPPAFLAHTIATTEWKKTVQHYTQRCRACGCEHPVL